MADRSRTSNLGRVVRGVFVLRLVATTLSVPALVAGPATPGWSMVALFAVLAGSLVPLLLWERAEPVVLAHPLFLGGDLALAVTFLMAAGIAAPFVVATLGTAVLGGLLYRLPGAVLCAAGLAAGYLAAGMVWTERGAVDDSVMLVLVVVALYPLLAGAGAALRHLLDDLEAAHRRAEAAVARAVTAEERARLARDLHDSVGKSLYGIALLAHGLRRSARDDEAAARAGAIEDAARQAAQQARDVISGLRLGDGDGRLPDRVVSAVRAWERDAGVAVALDVGAVAEPGARHRGEVLAVLGEALENVARHAGAQQVWVRLQRANGHVVLEVRDDGQGFDPQRASAARGAGHWGVVGMRERAVRCGGTLVVDGAPGEGTFVRLTVPVLDGDVAGDAEVVA